MAGDHAAHEEMTRRELLWRGGVLAASVALSACNSVEDGAIKQTGAAGKEPAATQPDGREFWVCVANKRDARETVTIEETGRVSRITDTYVAWTATLDDHGNVVSVDGIKSYEPMSGLFEVNEDGLVTRLTSSYLGGKSSCEISYERDDDCRPVTCSVKPGKNDVPYVLTIAYNDLGDIESLVYTSDEGARTQKFDRYGVETQVPPCDRNKWELPTKMTEKGVTRVAGREAVWTRESIYEYDDAGNLVYRTSVHRETIDFDGSLAVVVSKEEDRFEYMRVENPSLAVRLGSHLWGCRSSINDLLCSRHYQLSSNIIPSWELSG